MSILVVLLLVQVLYVHETGVVLYVWVGGCVLTPATGVVLSVRLRRLVTAPPRRPRPVTPQPPAPAAVLPVDLGGRHQEAPGRWPAALVGRLGEQTVACDVTADDVTEIVAAFRAGAR